MLQGFKVRLFPGYEQESLMWKTANAARFAWNWGLALQMKRFADGEKLLSEYDLRKEFTKFRDSEEGSWLQVVPAKACYLALYDLMTAFKNFFRIQKHGEKFTKQTVAKAKRLKRKLTPYEMREQPYCP